MSKQDFLKIQTCILKVNIHCTGCERKVKKLLQKIDGVYSVSIDAEQGKVAVAVAGDVDPAKLIKKLESSGKHAEIWGGQRGMIYNQNYPINHQFQNLQGEGGKDNKSQNQKAQKSEGGDGGQLAHFQNIKGAQGLKVPAKQHKSVKFNLPEEEFDASGDGFGEFDGHDNFEDNFGQGHPMHNKMMPVMGNGRGPHLPPAGMMNGPTMNNGTAKKSDVIDLPMRIQGKGGNYNAAENGNNGGKKSNGDHGGKNNKGEKQKGGGGGDINNNKKKKKNAKSGGGGLLGRFLGFGKKGGAANTNKNNNNGKEGEKGGGKLEGHSKNDFDFHDFDIPPHHDKNGKSGKGSNGNGNGNVGQMGPMNQKGPMGINYPMGQMGNIPAMNGGGEYYEGMQMQPTPYNLQQQQYMAMMMNQQQQQQANMNNMYQSAMMYGRPHPSMPPPPMPSHPMAETITHFFSDENTQGYCSIM